MMKIEDICRMELAKIKDFGELIPENFIQLINFTE